MTAPAIALECRDAVNADARLLWSWANDSQTRAQSFNTTSIPYDEHVRWLERRLASPNTRLWIFSDRGRPVGQVRCDAAADVAEISISVAPQARGRGYGKAMLTEACARARTLWTDGVRLRASVLADNVRSRRLFVACGFQEVDAGRRDGRAFVVFESRVPGQARARAKGIR